eukprot:5044089-Pyramimonas_sp.AAC.1
MIRGVFVRVCGGDAHRPPEAPSWLPLLPRAQGLVQSRGFGMFEIVDLCTAIGCAAVITINDQERAEDMADFVEYCWGGANTKWGALRIADGHPEVYNVTQ